MKRDSLPTAPQPTASLHDFLQREFGLAPDRLLSGADIYQDLDLDSLDIAEIALKFNDAFGRAIDFREFRKVRTLAQALDLPSCQPLADRAR